MKTLLKALQVIESNQRRNLSYLRNLSISKSIVTKTGIHKINYGDHKINLSNHYANLLKCSQFQQTRHKCDIVKNLTNLTPTNFCQFLKDQKVYRCFIVKTENGFLTSHSFLDDISGYLKENSLEYDNHEAIFFARGTRTDCLMSVFLWRTERGQAAGGVDLRPFSKMSDFIADGHRFSKKHGIKLALAGVWAGGGKALIASQSAGDRRHLNPEFRQQIFMDFGDFLTSLNGCMIAGAGIGSHIGDVDRMYTRSRYIANLSTDLGGTNDAVQYTGLGVVRAMEAALHYLNLGNLTGKTVAVQGAGNVGEVIIEQLLDKGVKHVYVAECNNMRADDVRDKMARKADGRLTINKVSFDDTSIFKQTCDIFSPCATSKVLNSRTIPLLDTKIICGACDSSASTEDDHLAIMEKKITYVTDVVPNRMGMVSKLLEHYGRLENDPELNKHLSTDWQHSIYRTTLRILQYASDENIHPEKAATILGEELSLEPHPLYPQRTNQIVENLIKSDWHKGEDFWRRRQSFLANSDML